MDGGRENGSLIRITSRPSASSLPYDKLIERPLNTPAKHSAASRSLVVRRYPAACTRFETSKRAADGRPVASFTSCSPATALHSNLHTFRDIETCSGRETSCVLHVRCCRPPRPVSQSAAHTAACTRFETSKRVAAGRPGASFTSCSPVRHASVHNKWTHWSMVNGCIGP